MKIYWATRLRGFLKHVSSSSNKLDFISDNNFYETNNFKQKLLSKIIRFKIFDIFGIYSTISISDKNCDYYASFNRFLTCDKPYFIYLENPTALYHYCLDRTKYPIGKRKFRRNINDKNLKGIICMSKSCMNTFNRINGELPKDVKIKKIYPLVPNNKNVDKKQIIKKSKRTTLELLYCVQGIRFVSKGGLEVLKAIKGMENVHLTIITKISDVDKKIINNIKNADNITLHDFNFKYDELEKIYANTNVLLHPTSDDSFGLTILEAMKAGCAIITTNLYAIPEIVENNVNGILLEPKYYFFNKDGIPNKKVWNHRKRTINSIKTSDRLIKDIRTSIIKLKNNRKLLEKFSLNSYLRSIDDNFLGENGIKQQWEDFVLSIDK